MQGHYIICGSMPSSHVRMLKRVSRPQNRRQKAWEMPEFWSIASSRKINPAHTGRKKEAVAYYAIESGLALFVSLLINICVVSVFAKVLYLI